MLTNLMNTLGFKPTPSPNMVRTLQDAYEAIRTHFLTQKERAIMPGGATCAYRGADGTKCAIGILIDDAHYSPRMEGQSLYDASVLNAVQASTGLDTYNEATFNFLRRAQGLHDNAFEVPLATQVPALDELALEYGLEVK